MYDVIFDEKSLEYLEKLEKKVRKRIFEKFISTKEHPFRYFERLSGRNEFKSRVGDYRIIADIDESSEKIYVLVIGHRKNIYKNL